jgi:hypothetical protein
MNRLVSIFLAVALLFMAYDATGQSVVLKRTPKSMNQKTGTKTWEYNTGLRVVGKKSKVYLTADTTGSGANVVTTFAWSFDGVPPGSTLASFDSGSSHPVDNSFTPDTTGWYYISVAGNGKVSRDTILASTYGGVDPNDMFSFPGGCYCHSGDPYPQFNAWKTSNHATIFYRGVTGQLEVVTEINKGAYAKNCPQCHTTGFELGVDNGNWKYLARTSFAGIDTTWYVGLPTTADGADVLITYKDTNAVWSTIPTGLRATSNIGCENCHGPLNGHKGTFDVQKKYIDVSLNPGVCNVCHDGSTKHSIGTYFRTSAHATLPHPESGAGCAPCHMGSTFVKWVRGDSWQFPPIPPKKWPYDSKLYEASDAATPITCAVCHEPHTMQIRTVSVDSLMNGYRPPVGTGGMGALCMNCHRSRVSSNAKIKPNSPPYYGFSSRFYPHHSNQADMLLGQNAWEYGDSKLTGVNTHASLTDGCVTCHMATRNGLPNHTWSMDPSDPNYQLAPPRNFNPVSACAGCHGTISDYSDVMAMYDYDKNGKVEGVETEVAGLMASLKAKLPQNASGDVIGEGSVTKADSAAINGRLDLVTGIWTYWWVYMDGSNGMHNAKYAIALLQKALGYYPLSVERTDMTAPESYALSQNYPNPFNPTTNIRFSLPQSGPVRVDVYNILGEHVTTLLDDNMGAGNFQVTWNGMDKNGSKVASGMYIYRLQAANKFSAVKKMLLVK